MLSEVLAVFSPNRDNTQTLVSRQGTGQYVAVLHFKKVYLKKCPTNDCEETNQYVCTYVFMRVCLPLSVLVFVCVSAYLCVCVCVCLHTCACLYVCVCVCV